MPVKRIMFGVGREVIPDLAFYGMSLFFKVYYFLNPQGKYVKSFGIKHGQVVVDYGCGPGRYLRGLSTEAGATGRVYGADIHELALHYSMKRIKKYDLKNVELLLVHDYHCDIGEGAVDFICALDMLHLVENAGELFRELHRIIKPDGTLIIDDGHQKREVTRVQLNTSNLWNVLKENKDHLKCSPK